MTWRGAVVVMGVSGSGKSALGAALAVRVGARFIDADDLHPTMNVAKMTAGHELDDDDRRPWLDAVADELRTGGVIVACSALRRHYRDRLRLAAPQLVLVFLHGEELILARRMRARRDHFMPVSLLSSQFAALEPPSADEHPINADADRPLAELVDDIIAVIARARASCEIHV